MIYSWLAPGTVSILISVLFYLIAGNISYKSQISHLSDELGEKSTIIARRLSAELLLGQKGAPDAVAELLKKELAVNKIQITDTAPCLTESDSETCSLSSNGTLNFFRKIPFIDKKTFVMISLPIKTFLQSLQPSLLLWIVFPVLLFLSLGLYFQKLFLRKFIIRPIESLVETTTGTSEPRDFWPKEILGISSRLSKSYEERDQIVFGKLASGVVHDVKTLIQSIVSATSLVDESDSNTDVRSRRLELLYKACKGNLRRIDDIINHTLDGSRDIPIKKQNADLSLTVSNSIQTLKELSASRNVKLLNQTEHQSIIFPHDPIQLERAFTNLIKNGIEAFDNQRDSEHPRTLKVTSTPLESEVLITVEDSGPGFDVSPDKVFKALKTTKAHGHGLGLFISKRIIEGHHGSVEAGTSDELKGARLSIRLRKDDYSTEELQ